MPFDVHDIDRSIEVVVSSDDDIELEAAGGMRRGAFRILIALSKVEAPRLMLIDDFILLIVSILVDFPTPDTKPQLQIIAVSVQ